MDPHFGSLNRLVELARTADPDFSALQKPTRPAPAPAAPQLPSVELPAVPQSPLPVLHTPADIRKLFGFGAGQGCQFVFGPITVQFTAFNVSVDDTTVSVTYDPKQVDFLMCRAGDSSAMASAEFTVIVGTAQYRCVFIGGKLKLPAADVVVLPLVRVS